MSNPNPLSGRAISASLSVFVGQTVIGGYQVTLKFDPAVVRVTAVRGGTTPGFTSVTDYTDLAAANLDGNLTLVHFQTGTTIYEKVNFAVTEFDVVGATGAQVEVTLSIESLIGILQDGSNYELAEGTRHLIGPVIVTLVTEPETTIINKPAHPSNSSTAEFSFTSTNSQATFRCRLDGGDYTICTSPMSYPDRAEGSHSFSVKSVDPYLNEDSSPASYTWTIDLTSPVVSQFNIPSLSRSLTIPITSLAATDNFNFGVTYIITETPAQPITTDTGWSSIPPGEYKFLLEGEKTLYAWAKDAAGNVSAGLSAIVIVDWTAPTVTSFVIPTASNTLAVGVTSFIATDNVAVTGYLTTETAIAPDPAVPGWRITAQTSYTFSSEGVKTLYGWTKDAAGNVSVSKGALVNIDTIAPTVTVFEIPTTSNSLILPITIFTATDNPGGTGIAGYLVTETITTPGAGDQRWSASAPKSYKFNEAGQKTLYTWAKDAAGNVSASESRMVEVEILTWVNTYGGQNDDWANSIQVTNDGGYTLAGVTWSFGAGWDDAWVIKLNGDGNIQWQKTYGGDSSDHTNSIRPTTDGGYIVGGTSSASGFSDIWLVKLDGDGNIQWQKTYNNTNHDVTYSIEDTIDGGYIAAGLSWPFGGGKGEAWVMKLDESGNILWQKSYGSAEGAADFYYVYSLQQTTDGGFLMAGGTHARGASNNDIWITKLDGSGDIQWQKSYGGHDLNGSSSVQLTTDGGYIVAGWTRSYGAGSTDAWIFKLDGDGNIQWQKTYGGPDSDGADAIQQTDDGGYIFAGWTYSFGAGDADAWLVKLDEGGNIQWQKTYGGQDGDHAKSIQKTPDGSYIVAGSTSSFGAGKEDVWVMKLDGNGNIFSCSGALIGTPDAIGNYSDAATNSANATVKNTTASSLTSSAVTQNTDITPDDACTIPNPSPQE
ncbi:MAG: hypothetical protein HY730_04615 [Candidatus Tectomicrobia bacterium]|uniref:Cohesin domain-containing protein n=1 Tax=Tectimicrobiota bacterium TaxID=2528274 RepID=A0A933GLJ2_UNCTE|nr:hypothetical protein [Candidatus Tectomicrobia bacterium]